MVAAWAGPPLMLTVTVSPASALPASVVLPLLKWAALM
jgi:hypothetical protein